MIASAEWFNPTKMSGLLAYGTAVTCCAIAWVTAEDLRQRALLLTLIESFFLFDIALDWRLRLHDVFEHIAQRHNEYASRRLPQVIVMCLLLGLLILSLLIIWRFLQGRFAARLTNSGVLLSLALWWTEVISLHQVDHAFYYRLGKIFGPLGDLMAVGVFWLLAAFMASAGILMESRHSKSARRTQMANRC